MSSGIISALLAVAVMVLMYIGLKRIVKQFSGGGCGCGCSGARRNKGCCSDLSAGKIESHRETP